MRIEFQQSTFSGSFNLPPARAIAFFQAKGLRPSFAWQDMIGGEHDRAFTVAKMLDLDLLATVREHVDVAIAEGKNARWFRDQLQPILEESGWWGKKEVRDPLTGEVIEAQLGSPRRLNTIFRTNLQAAYGVGEWQQIQRQKESASFLMYDALDDHRTRPEHAARDNTIRPVDDRFWLLYFPPNGWNCRCGVIQLTQADLDHYGLEVSPPPEINFRRWTNPRTGQRIRVPEDLDPGWDHNPGAALEAVQQTLSEKIQALPPDMQVPARWGRLQDLAAYETLEGVQTAARHLSPPAKRLGPIQRLLQLKAAETLTQMKKAQQEAAQAAAQAELRRAAELATEKSAQLALARLKAGTLPDPGGHQGRALRQLEKTPDFEQGSATERLESVRQTAAQIKAKKDQQRLLSKYKQKVLAGKPPSPAQAQAFNRLEPEEKRAFLEKLERARKEKAR